MVSSVPVEANQILDLLERLCKQSVTYVLAFEANAQLKLLLSFWLVYRLRILPQLIFVEP